MTIGTFDAIAHVVEQDTTRIIGPEEQSLYSIVDHLQSRLNALGWMLEVLPDMGGWPEYDSLKTPSVYVNLDTVTTAGVELGSDGSRSLCLVMVYGASDAQRLRLAGLIRKIFDRTIPLFSYTTGNEDNPTPTGEYFITDSVGWRKLPSPYNESDKQQYRALITATLRRVE